MLADAEGTARRLYEDAGFEYRDAVEPSLIADRLLGPAAVRVVSMAGLARLTSRAGRHWIHVSPRVREPEWLIGHELAHWSQKTSHGATEETEALCDLVGACLLMPPHAFRQALGEHGPDFQRLAEHFKTTPTAVALRFGEVTGEGIAIVTPRTVLARGDVEITSDQARALAKGGPGIVATDLGRRRVALRSR